MKTIHLKPHLQKMAGRRENAHDHFGRHDHEEIHFAQRSLDRLPWLALTTAALLLLPGCNLLDKPPGADDIYKAVSGMKEQPFNIEGASCKPAAAGAYDCQFSASIVAGYLPGYVGDTRPDYKIVQIHGRFSKTGDRWTAADVSLLTTP